MTMNKFYRQGDVGLLKVEALPKGAEKQQVEERIILAYGEVTGHAHAIAADDAALYFEGARRFLEVCYKADLTHEEHGRITLPAGTYKVIIQREYTPNALRIVKD